MRRSAALIVVPLIAAAITPAVAEPATGTTTEESYVVTTPRPGSFPLAANGKAAPIVVSEADYPGVVRVVGDLRDDVERGPGGRPVTALNDVPAGSEPVLVGTIGQSPLVDNLVQQGKLDVRGIEGKWETSLQQVVRDPLPGIRSALVIAGSDQRGTIYGAYDVSKKI